jgi:hypothetical protein
MVECCIKPRGRSAECERRLIRSETGRAGERVCQTRHGSADDKESRDMSGYDLPLAAVSVGPLEEADLFILRSGEPEIGEGDGDLN